MEHNPQMADRFTTIDKKLDKLVESLHSMDKTLVKQNRDRIK